MSKRAANARASAHPRGAPGAHAAALYEAMQALVRTYQLRDRDRACYGDVTPNECYALEAIERAGRVSVNELAAALGLHKSNASRLADALVDRGLVARRADPRDGRARRLEATPRGIVAHAAIRAGIEKRYRGLLAGVPAASRGALVALVRALTDEAAARIGYRVDAASPRLSQSGRRTSCS
jgi:DNA-binding MarR family transcriptional regulator